GGDQQGGEDDAVARRRVGERGSDGAEPALGGDHDDHQHRRREDPPADHLERVEVGELLPIDREQPPQRVRQQRRLEADLLVAFHVEEVRGRPLSSPRWLTVPMQIRVSADPAGEAARWMARRVGDAVRQRGGATLALSGGSTAPAMIAALDLPWEHVAVWQVDERIAPDGHAARNANQLDGLACPVHRMPVTANDLRAAARHYAARLPERFDV